MYAMRTHVAGVDVHKQILAITILTGDADKEPVSEQFECNTFTEDLMAMAVILKEHSIRSLTLNDSSQILCVVPWHPVIGVGPDQFKVFLNGHHIIKGVGLTDVTSLYN